MYDQSCPESNADNPADTMPALAVFHRLRMLAQWRFDYEVCHQAACRKRRFCTGGPRGTFRRHRVPACMIVNLLASGGDAARLLAETEAERQKNRRGCAR